MFINSLRSPALWPNDEIQSKAFSFDSENFSIRLPVPKIDFANLSLEKQVDADEDNYFELLRRDGKTGLKLRNRQELILGAFELALSINDSGDLSGNLSGRLGLEGPSPLDALSDRISMSYRSSRLPEFIMNRYFFGVGCRLQMGSKLPLGQACILELFSEKALEDRDCQ